MDAGCTLQPRDCTCKSRILYTMLWSAIQHATVTFRTGVWYCINYVFYLSMYLSITICKECYYSADVKQTISTTSLTHMRTRAAAHTNTFTQLIHFGVFDILSSILTQDLMMTISTVSYTHLDVYKRQVLHS